VVSRPSKEETRKSRQGFSSRSPGGQDLEVKLSLPRTAGGTVAPPLDFRTSADVTWPRQDHRGHGRVGRQRRSKAAWPKPRSIADAEAKLASAESQEGLAAKPMPQAGRGAESEKPGPRPSRLWQSQEACQSQDRHARSHGGRFSRREAWARVRRLARGRESLAGQERSQSKDRRFPQHQRLVALARGTVLVVGGTAGASFPMADPGRTFASIFTVSATSAIAPKGALDHIEIP